MFFFSLFLPNFPTFLPVIYNSLGREHQDISCMNLANFFDFFWFLANKDLASSFIFFFALELFKKKKLHLLIPSFTSRPFPLFTPYNSLTLLISSHLSITIIFLSSLSSCPPSFPFNSITINHLPLPLPSIDQSLWMSPLVHHRSSWYSLTLLIHQTSCQPSPRAKSLSGLYS